MKSLVLGQMMFMLKCLATYITYVWTLSCKCVKTKSTQVREKERDRESGWEEVNNKMKEVNCYLNARIYDEPVSLFC